MTDEKLTFKEAFVLTCRGYGIWWKKSPSLLLSSSFLAAITALSPFVGIYIVALLINEIAGARDRYRLIFFVVAALVSAAVLALLRACLERWKNYAYAPLWHTRNEIYTDKLLAMHYSRLNDSNTFELLSHISQSENWAGLGLSQLMWRFEFFMQAIISVIGAMALSVSLFTLPVPESAENLTWLNNPLLILMIIATMLVVTVFSPALANKGNAYWTKFMADAHYGNRRSGFFFGFGGQRNRALDVRMYRQDRVSSSYNITSHIFAPGGKLTKAAKGPMGLLYAASVAVGHVFTAVIYIFVCLKAWAGAFGVGSVTQYIQAITALSRGVSDLIESVGSLRQNAVFLKVHFEFADLPNDLNSGMCGVNKHDNHEISFRNVNFKYPGTEEYALKNFSLTFSLGQRLAVVGENGSGKTTFIKLLCRLYDPTDGEILLNGKNIKQYDMEEYLGIFSVVFQDFKLLSLPLGQNVAAAEVYDPAKATDCLIRVGFGEKLASMDLETCLYKEFEESGVDISGGEAQKIAMARALYRDAPFIILDEPTAALDPIAEFEIYSKMNEIVGNKTAIFISHRLSSCRFCKDIAVFNAGELTQFGSHDKLMTETEGKYLELWNAQARYYQ